MVRGQEQGNLKMGVGTFFRLEVKGGKTSYYKNTYKTRTEFWTPNLPWNISQNALSSQFLISLENLSISWRENAKIFLWYHVFPFIRNWDYVNPCLCCSLCDLFDPFMSITFFNSDTTNRTMLLTRTKSKLARNCSNFSTCRNIWRTT